TRRTCVQWIARHDRLGVIQVHGKHWPGPSFRVAMLHPAAPALVLTEPGDDHSRAPHASDPDPYISMGRLVPASAPDPRIYRLGGAVRPSHQPTLEHLFDCGGRSGTDSGGPSLATGWMRRLPESRRRLSAVPARLRIMETLVADHPLIAHKLTM